MFTLRSPHSFRSSPLLTTTFQAILINILANVIAQYISYRKTKALLAAAHSPIENLALDLDLSGAAGFGIDARKVMQFVCWTVFTVPMNFRWQGWLERRWPAYYSEEDVGHGGEEKRGRGRGLPVVEVGVGTGEASAGSQKKRKRNFKHTFLKILVDQTCAAPVNCTLFLTVMTLLKGGSFHDAVKTVQTKFWPLKFAGWKIWPLVGLVNFTFVPVERRVIVSTIIGLCWNVFLVLFIS